MSEDHVPRKRPRKLGLFLACGVCAASLVILISRAAWLIDVPRSGGHAFGLKPVEQFPKRRIDGEHRFLWASGSIDPVQPDSEWFDLTGSPLAVERFEYGIGKDKIRPIDKPVFVEPDDPRLWAKWGFTSADHVGELLVLGYVNDGEARAYPVRLLNGHELVNDTVGGKPVTVGW